jgi:hypothetical protein
MTLNSNGTLVVETFKTEKVSAKGFRRGIKKMMVLVMVTAKIAMRSIIIDSPWQ